MQINKCIFCSKKTNNPKFCSNSCAAKINNKIPKRKKKQWFCKKCKNACASRRNLCNECFLKQPEDLTIEQAIYNNHHRSSAYALIRSRARATKKSKQTKLCEKCGYNKHVEVCHIKPISSFDLNTKISIVNHETNLLILCPNCHWEFDKSQKTK